jgi:hypothetical protein
MSGTASNSAAKPSNGPRSEPTITLIRPPLNVNGSSTADDASPKRQPSRHIKLATHLQRPHLTDRHRTLSDALRAERSREEQETLLPGDDEVADPDAASEQTEQLSGPRRAFSDANAELDVYYTIHRIRRLVLAVIEDPYSMDQLKEPRMNVLIVKPLVDRLYDEDDISVGMTINRDRYSGC